MLKVPQTEARALWKERYRTSGLRLASLARLNPSRGIAITSASGTGQIYAWDVSSGALRQLTQSKEGVFAGTIVYTYATKGKREEKPGIFPDLSYLLYSSTSRAIYNGRARTSS